MADFDDYQWLAADSEAERFLEAHWGDERSELQQLNELRKRLSPARARLIVELLSLRRRGAEKFGPLAAKLFFTPLQLEQATDRDIAAYKAHRMGCAAGGRAVHDFCCGIGGDLLALAATGQAVGWELDPVVSLLAERNLHVAVEMALLSESATSVEQADVAEATLSAGDAWHVDPDRRAGGRRSTTLEHHSPPPEIVNRWRRAAPTGAVKLAPGSDIPPDWQDAGELEWISRRRECRQLVIWFGESATAPGQRRATTVSSQRSDDPRLGMEGVRASSFCGLPDEAAPSANAPQRFVYEPDPAVVAARLAGAMANQYGLATLGAGSVYLTGEEVADDALLTRFEVLETMPLSTKDVARWLAARGVGRIEIKKRGVSVDPERFRRDLRLRGDDEATVILTRIGQRQLAIIARRHQSLEEAAGQGRSPS